MLLQDAREQVCRAARRERHDDGDWPLGPSLLRGRRPREDESGGQSGCEHSTHADPFGVSRYRGRVTD
jgi:hypothetical protein